VNSHGGTGMDESDMSGETTMGDENLKRSAVYITGVGRYLPGAPIPFDEVDEILGPFDWTSTKKREWYQRKKNLLRSMLGIEWYHYAIEPETGEALRRPSEMAADAARAAMESAGIGADDIDVLIYAGWSQDQYIGPPTSTEVQRHLGIERCAEYSIHANCTAPYKALELAASLLSSGVYRTALIASSHLISPALVSRYFNEKKLEKNQALLRFFLSDGAGALVVQREPVSGRSLRIKDTFLESASLDHPRHLYNRVGSATVDPRRAFEQGLHHISLDYRDTTLLGPPVLMAGARRLVDRVRRRQGDDALAAMRSSLRRILVNVPTPHLIHLVEDEIRLKLRDIDLSPFDLSYSSRGHRGYTGAAAMPIALGELFEDEKLEPGDLIVAFAVETSQWMTAGLILEYSDAV